MKPTDPINPPRWPLQLLRFFVKDEYLEEIEGDMEELFHENREQFSYRQARRMYTWEMLCLLRPILVKRIEGIKYLNQYSMLRNYSKTSLRSLMKNPLSSFINVFGLSVAIGICIMVYAFMAFDYSIDQFHENKNKVYLVTFVGDRDGTVKQYGMTPRPLGERLRADFTHVKKVCRVEDRNVVVKSEDQVFQERIRYVDPTFLEMFTFPLKWGLPRSLADPNSIIFSQEMAIKYFGQKNPVGRFVKVNFGENRSKTFKISGVAQAFPKARTVDFDMLVNFENLRAADPAFNSQDWTSFVNATLIQVDHPTDLYAIQKGMEPYRIIQNQAQKDWNVASFELVSLADLHHRSGSITNGISYDNNGEARLGLPILALFMLALACFNYINIAIVSAARRLKEIGVRKVMGATKGKVVVQFLAENILVTSFALATGVGLAIFVFIPWFNDLANEALDLKLLSANLWLFLSAVLMLTGVVSGLYPAFYIARFEVITIFKGSVRFGTSNPLTKTFLGFQLVLACVLITGAVIFTQNASFLYKKDWGYQQKSTLYVPVPDRSAFEQLQAKMVQHPQVLSISGSAHHLGKEVGSAVVHLPDRKYEVLQLGVDAHYFETMGLQLQAGRLFREHPDGDRQAVVVNELLVKTMNLQKPIGQLFRIDSTRYEVIGVVKDFNVHSFYDKMRPTLFKLASPNDYRFLSLRVKSGTEHETYQTLRAQWAALFPETPFGGGHQEDIFTWFYEDVARSERFFKAVAMVAVLLAGLGLYGLARLNISGRVKEFSIRKVLGADIRHMAAAILKQYALLTTVALLIGAPVSYLLVEAQLNSLYAYPMPMNPWGVVLAMVILVLVLVGVVSTQIGKVVKANPVEGLKQD
jgi:putative ABC transport system permease protein